MNIKLKENYPKYIDVLPLNHNGKQIKDGSRYDVQDWINKEVGAVLDINKKNFGYEGEGFFIDDKGDPLAFYDGKYINIKEADSKIIKEISEGFSDKKIAEFFKKGKNNIFENEANICGELDLSTYEIGFNNGLSIIEIFDKIIHVYQDLNKNYDKGVKYLPYGNLPLDINNTTNLSNPYYKYIFNSRDGHDGITDFRGAGLQIHKEMDNYELSIYTFNHIRHILPVFQILSQNSPFKNGEYNGNLSERTATKFNWKMTGIPNSIDNSFIIKLQSWLNTSINSVTPYYYAVRYPRVDIKTIENCSMDTVSDLPLLFSLLDLYYRVTERLKMAFITGEKLPLNIFGNCDGDFIETHIIQENYNKAIRNGTKSRFNILGLGRNKIEFDDLLNNIFKFIEDVPSQFPEGIAEIFGIKNTDPTIEILSKISRQGNLAEKTLHDLGVNRNPGVTTSVPDSVIKDHILDVSIKFQKQLNKF